MAGPIDIKKSRLGWIDVYKNDPEAPRPCSETASSSKRRHTTDSVSPTIKDRINRADSVIPMLSKRSRSRSSFGSPSRDPKRSSMPNSLTPTPTPSRQSPGSENANGETPSTRSKLGVLLSRKESVQAFGDAALISQSQKKLFLQGKLLQKKNLDRKQSFLKEGGIKSIMNAPKIVKAFQAQNSVSFIFIVFSGFV